MSNSCWKINAKQSKLINFIRTRIMSLSEGVKMIRTLIDSVSFWWLIIICIVFFLVLTYFSARISVYFFSRPVDINHRDLANSLIGILSGGFSILLAFVIINTWNYFLMARSATSKEADYLALI